MFYNGSYCITKYFYNDFCTQRLQCNLYCLSQWLECCCLEIDVYNYVSNYYWNETDCRQTCNNISTGVGALPCDDTLNLYCYSNYTGQCVNTLYWDISDQ